MQLGTVAARPVLAIDGVFEVGVDELTSAFAGEPW